MFIFITQHHIGIGVQPVDKDAHPYCDCLENNGRHMGCEYTICGCLQLAAINTIIQRKMFPYFAQGDNKGCLRAFYLNSRYAIMECNPKCTCGDNCKTKVVQKGRQVALEIFKTLTRGWGKHHHIFPSFATTADPRKQASEPLLTSRKANLSTHTGER